jgi:hypothetical protein
MRNHILSGLTIAVIAMNPLAPNSGGFITASQAAETAPTSQISNERGIKITATLQTLTSAAKTWDVEVIMETHTRALDDDMSRSAVLWVDGKRLMPSGWQGDPPGGHHRKGVLSFQPGAATPAAVELQMRLSNDPAPRSFRWRLQ